MTDIVERLREFPEFVEMINNNYEVYGLERSIESEAADTIDTLRQRVKELEANYAAVAHNIASSPAKVLEESVLIGQTLNRLDKVQQALLFEREMSDKLVSCMTKDTNPSI